MRSPREKGTTIAAARAHREIRRALSSAPVPRAGPHKNGTRHPPTGQAAPLPCPGLYLVDPVGEVAFCGPAPRAPKTAPSAPWPAKTAPSAPWPAKNSAQRTLAGQKQRSAHPGRRKNAGHSGAWAGFSRPSRGSSIPRPARPKNSPQRTLAGKKNPLRGTASEPASNFPVGTLVGLCTVFIVPSKWQ